MSDPSERLRDVVAEVLASVLHERWCPLPSKCSWSADDWDEAAPLADALMPLLARVRAEAEQRRRAEGWDKAVRTIVDAGLINSTVLAYGGAPSNPYRADEVTP